MRWVQSSDEQLYQGVYLKNQEEAVMLGFIIWAFVGIAVIAIGIFAFFSKKAVGVWANMEMFEVTDYKKYN